MAWLLDTNILSELRRLKPEPKVLTFVAGHPLEELFISTVTLAELRFGIELLSEVSPRRPPCRSRQGAARKGDIIPAGDWRLRHFWRTYPD